MSAEHSKIRFAIVGCGHIGKRHGAMIMNNPETELIAWADNRPNAELNLNGGEIPFYSSLEELLTDSPEFDVLCIATPNGLHEEHAIRGLRSGHHVVIEKPMALTKAGCEHIIYESLHQHKQVFSSCKTGPRLHSG
jgi:predicted dehydrogenase